MSLELIKEEIKVNRVIADNTTQTIIQSDIIVPDTKPDVSRICLIDGEAKVKSTETLQDKMVINGYINYKILYTSDDENQSIKGINTYSDFNCTLDAPGARQNLKSTAVCDIEHIEYDILNGRKISVKTILSAKGKVFSEEVLDVVNDIEGSDNVQILRNSISLNSYIGTTETEFSLQENLEIPAGKPSITEVLRNDVKFSGVEYNIVDNDKVEVTGNLNISTLYVGDDERHGMELMEHEIPFKQTIELYGVNEDAICNISYSTDVCQFTVSEDSDGEARVLASEIPVNLSVSAYAKRAVSYVEDAYIPGSRVQIDKKEFDIESVVSENSSKINIKEVLNVAAEGVEISEIFNIMCKPVLIECRVYENKLTCEGILAADILYMTNSAEQPLSCSKQEIPFKSSIDIPGINPEMNPEVQTYIEHYNYSMVSPYELELRAVLDIDIKINERNSIPLITEVSESPAEDMRNSPSPSIILYFVQPGDTLWKVAKKYSSTIEDIISINNLNENEELYPGRQLIVKKKI